MDIAKKIGLIVSLAFFNFIVYYFLLIILAISMKPGGLFSGDSAPFLFIHFVNIVLLTTINTIIIKKILKEGSYLACIILFGVFPLIYVIKLFNIYGDWTQNVTSMNFFEYCDWIFTRDTTFKILIGVQISILLATIISKVISMVYLNKKKNAPKEVINLKTKKPSKKIMIGISVTVTVLVTLFCVYWTQCRVDILASTKIKYLDDYRDYYFYTKVQTGMGFMQNISRQIIYFKPGLKEAMLEKIKEDVSGILETLVEQHSDIFYKYEISDDFTIVNLYVASSYYDEHRLSDVESEAISRISSLMPLYHEVKEGGTVASGEDYTFNIIEPNN